MHLHKKSLRHSLRVQRRKLPAYKQAQASACIAHFFHEKFLKKNRQKNFAFYMANDGEVSPKKIVALAQELGKKIFYPVLLPNKSLKFRQYKNESGMTKNRYGITEPKQICPAIANKYLDIIVIPLVGFDSYGTRLGMGGGYYDRTLAELSTRRNKPLLVGLAHSFQQVPSLPTEDWDVPLDYVVTEIGIVKTKHT